MKTFSHFLALLFVVTILTHWTYVLLPKPPPVNLYSALFWLSCMRLTGLWYNIVFQPPENSIIQGILKLPKIWVLYVNGHIFTHCNRQGISWSKYEGIWIVMGVSTCVTFAMLVFGALETHARPSSVRRIHELTFNVRHTHWGISLLDY